MAAVFYDTGGGDIYAGPTKEAVIAEMLKDSSDLDVSKIEEVPGDFKMRVDDENEQTTDQTVTLAEIYNEALGSYCICSDNC